MRKTKSYNFLLLFLAFFLSLATNSFAFSSGEEISSALRKPKSDTAGSAQNKDYASRPLIYSIDTDDILRISVWQNLGAQDGDVQREYKISRGDVMEISVWQWPDLVKEVIVRPDGKISFPLVGDVKAEGLTMSQLDEIFTKRLSEYIKSPEVSIMMKQFGFAAGSTNRGAMSFVKIDDLSIDDMKVRPDGKISFPLIGDVQAAGLTLDELREALTIKFSKLVHDVDVFVEVMEFGGNKVIMLGQVSSPGTYEIDRPVRLLEAISLAGGYTDDAILRNVFVLRGDLDNPKVFRVNVSKAITGRDFSQNMLLEPRDIVYIPKSFIADINYVLTQLVQPLTTSASAPPAIRAVRSRVVIPKK